MQMPQDNAKIRGALRYTELLIGMAILSTSSLFEILISKIQNIYWKIPASLAALSKSCSIRYFAGSPIGLSCIN
jgi:hypothetical protein